MTKPTAIENLYNTHRSMHSTLHDDDDKADVASDVGLL